MSYARKAVTRMTLDMSRVDLQRSETVHLLDTNRRWEVTLTNGGIPFRLPNNWTVSLVGVKPDEEGMMLFCSVADGRIIFDFAENAQLTTCAGAFAVQFDVWDEYGELVASPKIWLHVLPDVRPHEDLVSTGQYTTIGDLIKKEGANRVDIDKNADDIDVLEAARPMTGSFSVGDDLWTESDDGYTATIELTANPLRSGDVMLILPDGEDTRKASADVVVSVKSAENGAEADSIVLTAKSKPTETTLWYRYAVIKRGAEDTTMLPVAFIVGVNDVPKYIKDAIETFKNMGGAPVGSGTLVVPASEWSDGSPTTAYVDVPGNAMHAGSVMLLTPANDATKAAAEAARLSVLVDVSGDYPDAASDTVVLLRAETAAKPAIDMEFAYVILQTTATTSLVTLIGVDAAGGSEPTLVDLSRFEGEPDTESGLIKGYITEVFGEGEDAPTKVTEVVYDEDGNIIKIGNTAINWGGEA